MKMIKKFELFERKGDHLPNDDKDLLIIKELLSDIEDLGIDTKIHAYESFTDGYDEFRIFFDLKAKFGIYQAYEYGPNYDFSDIDRSMETTNELYHEMKKFTKRVTDDLDMILNYFHIHTQSTGHGLLSGGISFFRKR